MENAAKALIMAGSVLLAILVLTLGVILRSNLQGAADSYVETLDTREIIKYNNIFDIYANKYKVITAQEIVTLIEYAKKAGQGTKVYVNGVDKTAETNFNSSEFLEQYILYEDNEYIYNSFKYKDITYNNNGKVSEIKFVYVDKTRK